MTTTTLQDPTATLLDWHPTAGEVEAIVAEMRPPIALLAAEELRRLERAGAVARRRARRVAA